MLVQYICAAAGAAAVVRWVDGCGRAQKKEPPSGWSQKAVQPKRKASYEQHQV